MKLAEATIVHKNKSVFPIVRTYLSSSFLNPLELYSGLFHFLLFVVRTQRLWPNLQCVKFLSMTSLPQVSQVWSLCNFREITKHHELSICLPLARNHARHSTLYHPGFAVFTSEKEKELTTRTKLKETTEILKCADPLLYSLAISVISVC